MSAATSGRSGTPRKRTVTYRGTDLHLTTSEYAELLRLSHDDPVEADRLSREYRRREQVDQAARIANVPRDLVD